MLKQAACAEHTGFLPCRRGAPASGRRELFHGRRWSDGRNAGPM